MVTPKDIEAAHFRIAPHLHQTPVLTSRSLNQLANAELYFKCENFQRAGSFKFRGATNTLRQLDNAALTKGVATTSSGNHGAALTLAASLQNAHVTVVMPHNTPAVKVENVKRYGGEIVFCEPTHESREGTLSQLVERSGATVVHPYNDERIIAGQGTAAWELLTAHPDLDAIVAPVSGGGLLSGTLLAAQGKNPKIRVYGAEPLEADDTIRSLEAGRIVPNLSVDTIADGLRAQIGPLTFPIIQQHVTKVLPITEDEIIAAMRLLWGRLKIIVEPSGAVPLAAVLKRPEIFCNQKTGLILSGGNTDLDSLPWSR